MPRFNPYFWEVPMSGSPWFNQLPSEQSIWYETAEELERRWAQSEMLGALKPQLQKAMELLTPRQREILLLHLSGQTQERIAEQLNVAQSTVSRHLHGIWRNGRRVGGAVNKLRKILSQNTAVQEALASWQEFKAA